MPDKLDELYDALKADGAVQKDRENFRNFMLAPGKTGYENRKKLYDALKADGAIQSGTYEEFRNRLGLKAVKPASSPTPTSSSPVARPASQPTGTPMTDDDKRRMSSLANGISASVDAGNKRVHNQIAYAKGNSGLQVKPVKLGQNRHVVEKPAVGRKSTYITESGNEFGSRAEADVEQNAVDAYKDSMTVSGQLREAEKERERLDGLMRERMKELDEESGGIGEFLRNLANESHGMPGGLVDNNGMDKYRTDERFRQLESAARKNNLAIQTLRDKKSGQMNDFWHSMGTALTNGYTFSDGLSDMNDATALMDAQKRLDGIKKRAAGKSLTKEEEAAEAVLRNAARNDQVQGMYGNDYGAWSRTGSMFATSVDMMKDIMLTPGANGIAKGVAGKVAQTLGKGVARVAGEKVATNIVTRGILKGTGILLGAHTAGAVVSNTSGIGHLGGEIGKGVSGNVGIDGKGNYVVENQRGLMNALVDAERTQIGENGSEMFGEFIPGVGGVLKKGLEKIGLSKISNALTNIGKKDWYKQYSALLERGGYNGLPGEAIEEYEGMLFDAMAGNASEAWEQMKDPRTHVDIWLGCATMGALFGAVPMVAQGYHTAQYYRYKHETDMADKVAGYRMTAEKWEPLRIRIDGAQNGEMTDVVLDNIINNPDLHTEEKKAALKYVGNLQKMRGYNIAEANNSDEEAAEATEALNESFRRGHEADGQGRQDIYTELSMQDGVSEEEKQEAWNGVVQRINEDAATQAAVRREEMNKKQHTDGSFHTATLKEKDENGHDKQVFVIGGIIEMSPDGMTVDPVRSHKTVIIYDPTTGEQRMIDPTADTGIRTLGDVTSVEEQKNAIEEERRQFIQAQMDEAQGIIHVAPGEQITLPTGEQASVVNVDPEGENITVQTANGETGTVLRSDLQKMVDQARMEDYRLRHESTATEAEAEADVDADASDNSVNEESPAPANGAPAEYTADMEITIRDDDGSEKPAIVTGRVRYENGKFVPDENGQIIEYVVDDEARHDHQSVLDDKVVGYVDDNATSSDTEESAPPYALNDEISLQADDGSIVAGKVIAEEDEDGRIQLMTEKPVNGKQVNMFTRDELNGIVISDTTPAETNVSEGNNSGENIQDGGNSTAEDVPTDTEAQPSALSRIPKDENGTPLLEETDPETAWDGVVEFMGSDTEDAGEYVNGMVTALTKEVETAKKAVSKVKPTADLSAFKQAKAEARQAQATAEARLKKWQDIAAVNAARQKAESDRIATERAEADLRAHEQAVAAEQARQEEELRKREEQAQVGTNAAHPHIKEKWDAAPKVEGARNEIVLANGEKISGRYVLVESGAATPSHNPNAEFAKNEGFPVDENGQSVNDRDYERDKDAQAVTRNIAGQYDSRAMQAPVIVSNDGVVLSGNGRTMAGELAAANGTDDAYIEHLKKYGQQYGFTPEQVEGMEHPRVLFVPDEQMPYTAETFAKFNQQEMKGQSKSEQAVKLGKIVDDETFGRITKSINAYDTLGDFYADTAASTNAMQELLKAGAISQAQYAEMFDGDTISSQGREMLENMLIGKAFEGNPDAVRQITAFKSVRQSVISALAEISNNLQLGENYSLKSELAQAIDLVYQARNSGGQKAGERVSSYARQLNIFQFDEGESVADYTNATVLMLADVLNDGRVTLLRKALTLYNHHAQDAANGQMDLFTGGVESKEDILNKVKSILNYGTEQEQQSAINEAVERRTAEAGAEKDGNESVPAGSGNGGSEAGRGNGQDSNVNRGTTDVETNGGLAESATPALGPFGEIYTQFKGKPQEAIAYLLSKKGGEALGALHHKDIGDIDLVWGKEGTGHSDGYGLAKLAKYHPEVLSNLQEILDDMVVTKRSENRVQLESEKYQAAVRLAWNNNKKTWLLTMFEKKNSAPNNTTDTVKTHEGTENDTATPGNTVIPAGKDTEISHNDKENEQKNSENVEKSADSAPALKDWKLYRNNSAGGDAVVAVVGNPKDGYLARYYSSKEDYDGQLAIGEREISAEELSENLSNGNFTEVGTVNAAIAAAEAEVDTNPTEAQKEAGNYRKGHVQVGTFDITIEQPKGSVRHGTDRNGKAWETKMANTYGYFRGTEGVDGDHIDVFLSDDVDGWNGRKVFVVDQYNEDGTFDEHKVMLGFNDMDEAESAYFANYSDNWGKNRRIDITPVALEDFEKWIDSSHRKTKAFAEYKGVKRVENPESAKATGENLDKPIQGFDGYTRDEVLDVVRGHVEEMLAESGTDAEIVGMDIHGSRIRGDAKEDSDLDVVVEYRGSESEDSMFNLLNGEHLKIEGISVDINPIRADKTGTLEKYMKKSAEYDAEQTKARKGGKLDKADDTERDERIAARGGLKKNHPDAIFMFETKDKTYELYGEDAVKASGILGTPLEKTADGLDMTSFSRDSLDGNLPKLVRAGVRCALVDYKKPKESTSKQPKHRKSKWVNDEDAERFEELQRRLRKKIYGQLNVGIDPEVLAIGIEMSYLMLKKGARKFNEFAKNMIEVLGEEVRPYIKAFYNGARDMPGMEEYESDMTPYDEVRIFDVMNFDKEGAKDIVATAEHIVREQAAEREAKEATDKLKQERNEQRKETEQEVASNTEALASEAATVASEVESKLPSARSEQEVNDLAKNIDDAIDKVNDQLALLGYYEAEPVESDFNEAYGYMRNAEKKAVKNVTELFKTLTKELGISDPVVYDTKGKKQKSVTANIAPAGGDVTMRFMLNRDKGVELYIDFMLEPDYENNRDNLVLKGIMFRPERNLPNGGRDYLRANNFFPVDVTMPQMLQGIRSVCQEWLPAEDYVAMAQRIAAENAGNQQEKPSKEPKSKKKSVSLHEQTIPDLFSGLFGEDELNSKDNDTARTDNTKGISREDGSVGSVPADRDGVLDTRSTGGPERGETTGVSDETGAVADGTRTGVPGRRSSGSAEGGDNLASEAGQPLSERGQRVRDRADEDGRSAIARTADESQGTSQPTGRRGNVKSSKQPEPKFTRNYLYPEDASAIDNMTPQQRLSANVEALEVVRTLMKEGREATAEEREILGKYRGWGGVELGRAYSTDMMRRSFTDRWGTPTEQGKLLGRLADVIDELDPKGERGVLSAINRAALTSYYTPTGIAKVMNRFAELAGFKGGSMLDPSMGNGVFEGTMSKGVQQRTMIHGIELDWLTGQIARNLYPDANVLVTGYEQAGTADNAYDVVMSNIPFGSISVTDKTWKHDSSPVRKAAQGKIHNYFAVKMLDNTRPGGLCVIMTSNAILDTKGNQIIREHLADQAEVLGVVRLPDNTFKGAGTSVVTDVIFLRKYKDDADRAAIRGNEDYTANIEKPFLSSGELQLTNPTDGKTYKVAVNGYFTTNKGMMIGDAKAGGQYRADEFGLGSSLGTDELANAMSKIVEKKIVGDRKGKLFDTHKTEREVHQAVSEAYKGDGNFISSGNIVEQDGMFGIVTSNKNKYGDVTSTFNEMPSLKAKASRIRAMLPIREAMKELIAAEIGGTKEDVLKELRKKLQGAYDAYVKKFGHLNNKENDFLTEDIDGYTLRSLEKMKDGKFAGLSDIFTKNTIKPALDLSTAKTPQDAISLSLAEYGEINPSFMEDALGASWAEQCGESLFRTPFTEDVYETADAYLSGDVKTKLEQAREAAKQDKAFERNVEALEAVQPKDIPFDEISIRMGARWIPADVYTDFMYDMFGIHKNDWKGNKSGVEYMPEVDQYVVNVANNELGGEADAWRTSRRAASEVFTAALQDKSLSVFDTIKEDGVEKKILNKEETELLNNKIQDLRTAFEDWLSQNPEREEMLMRMYNDKFNRTVLRKFDGSHLNVAGLMGKELRPHQKDAVWMLVNNRGGIVDHIVGAGKTLVMQSAIMEMRRMGIAKKPMIIGLKATVAQIAKEFREAYPAARILAPTEKDFAKENRKKFMSQIALNDYDCVILSHDQYCMLPHTEEVERGVIDEQMMQLDAAIEYLYGQSDKSQLTKKQIKGLEKRKANLEAKLDKLLDRKIDREFTFEGLGVDYLFVDECQHFKSLPYVSTYDRVAGLGDKQGSQRAIALLNGVRYLQRMHQGDRGTVFLSGTTISNSLSEIYHLLNYLRPSEMERLGMTTFDAWAGNYAIHTAELEYGVTNELKEKDRFRSLTNIPELSKMYAEIADVRNDMNLQLPKPKMRSHVVTVPQSDIMQEINAEIVKMVKNKDGMYFGIDSKDTTPWGLLASTLSAKAAINPRLIDEAYDSEGGKIPAVCENVKKIYDQFAGQKGTQLIFCDTGVPGKGKKYDAYSDIINRLVNDYGIPRKEIADIHEASTDEKRKALFAKVNDGSVRILIGGTKNMGTGVNVQKRIVAMHHVDVPWTPADREQREGRGVRQGNEIARDFNDDNVDVYFYATEGSLDMYKYQLQETKGKLFAQFKSGTIGERTFDEGDAEGDFDPAEVVAMLSGNPVIFEKSKQDKKVEKLRRAKRAYESDWQRRRSRYEELQTKKRNFERLLSLNSSDVRDLERGGFTPDEEGKYPATVTVSIKDDYASSRSFDKPKEAGEYIHSLLKQGKKVQLSGFNQKANVSIPITDAGLFGKPVAELDSYGGIKYSVEVSDDDTAAGVAFRNLLQKVYSNRKVYERNLEEVNNQLNGADPGENKFPKQAELDEALKEKKRLDDEYKKLSDEEPKADENKEDGLRFRDDESNEDLLYRIREDVPPRNTGIGYKVFVLKDGKLYPPMVANPDGAETPTGVWLDADAAPVAGLSKTGRQQVKAGGKGTQGGSGKLAYRPGWHLGEIPYALQFNRINPETGEKELFPANFVWAEVEYANDVDYQDEAMKYGMNANGKFQHSLAGLPRVPENGAYKYRTNPNPQTDPWIITGAMKVNRLLKPSEVDELVTAAGREPQQRQDGAVTDAEIEALNEDIDVKKREGDDLAGMTYEESLASARRVGYTKRQHDAMLKRQWRRMHERAEDTVSKLGLAGRVTILDNADGLKGRKAKAKGWYDAKTGKIVVVLGNHHGTNDVVRTILHEGVAHYGLRALFGENFNQFLDNVYQNADMEIRRAITEMAKRHGWDFRVATEEYLASLAEDTDFERAMRQGWWSRIKSLFLDLLHNIGLDGFFGVTLTDNELRYILWRSYENLTEPGRYNNLFREAKDISKKLDLKLASYDRELVRIHKLGRIDSSSNIMRQTVVADSGIRFRDGDFGERDRVTARDAYERMVSSGTYQFREAVQDSMLGLRKLYEAILGKKDFRIEDVAGYENAYLAENRMSSVNAAEQHEYYNEYMRPLLEAIGKITGNSNGAREALTDYMMAKHGLERNLVFAERDAREAEADGADYADAYAKCREKDYSGLTALTGEDDVAAAEAKAQQIVDDFEAAYDVTDLWDCTREATQATLEKIYKSGLLNRERYESIRDMFQYYIPLQGWDETTSDEVYGYLTSKNGPLTGSPIKHATGRKSKADDPIATIAMMADTAIRHGNRNLMKQRFLNFVLNNPSDLVSVNDLWLQYDATTDEWVPVFADLEADDSAADVERKVEAFEQRMEMLAEQDPDKYKRGSDAKNIPYKVVRNDLREHQVLVKRDGRTYVLTINGNPRAAQALNGLTNPDVEQGGVVGNMLKAGEYVNRQLSAFYTTRNPDFVVSNFLRDMLYSNCMTWVKESPRYALGFHKNFGKVNPAKMRQLLGKWENGTLDMSDKTEQMFYQFMRNGGETGYTSVRDIDEHKKAVVDELKKQGSLSRRAWSALGMQFDLLNRSVENCARFAAFMTSREMGRTIDRSIYDAKEVSVNFNKKGSGGKMVNATGQTTLGKIGSYMGGGGRLLFVFWNASVQGMTNFGRAGRRHPAKAIAGASTMFMLGYIIPQLAAMLGGGDGDDDDKSAYYNLPEYVRRSNICFRAGEQWVTIPLPIEFRAIYGLGELASGVISNNEHYEDNELAFQIASQVSQMLPLDMLEGGGGIMPFIPSIAKPFTEAYIMNKGWTGLPIYKDTPYNKNDPEWTKAYKSADKTLVGVSKWLNEATGGDDFKKGAIDINPAKIEYMLSGYFGGYFSTANKLKKMGETAIGDREFDWRNMLIANRIVKTGDERTEYRKLQNEYFKYLDEYEETKRLLHKYENAANEGMVEYAEKINLINNSPEYLRYEILDGYKDDINAYREDIAVETNEDEKEKLRFEMYEVMREAVDALHKVEN